MLIKNRHISPSLHKRVCFSREPNVDQNMNLSFDAVTEIYQIIIVLIESIRQIDNSEDCRGLRSIKPLANSGLRISGHFGKILLC